MSKKDTHAVRTEATPLWNDFIDKVSARDKLNTLMNYIDHKCFTMSYFTKNEEGEWLETPMSLPFKMERLLTICKHQRQMHITRLRSRGDPRCSAERPADDYLMIFDDDDLRSIYNTWRTYIQSHMKGTTMAAHTTMGTQQAHQLTKNTRDVLVSFVRLQVAAA